GVLGAVRENYKRENPFPVTPAGGVWIFFGALIGAKIYWAVQYGPTWVDDEGNGFDWYRVFFIWEGGMVYYGGLIGGFLGGVAYVKYMRVPILPMGDIGMPFLPLGHSIARLGCYLNGCCWGQVTGGPTGVVFPRRSLAYKQQLTDGLISRGADAPLPVHPTQLYEAFGLFAIFLIMRYAYKHKKFDGSVMLLYPLLYGILRFSVEAFRGDSARPLFGMTASQMIGLGLFLGAALLYVILFQTRWRGPGPVIYATPAPEGPANTEKTN
ncbi:MAG: prolipoprotein diacylglyceryl transferase, partial [Gammaproteobacteria bacterium]|nr:prolipoprotein diacylglyceryl transferase [Gammaproteobacteria bacterium]